MRCLFLDDSPERWEIYRRNHIGSGVVTDWAKNVQEAIHLLTSNCVNNEAGEVIKSCYDCVFLDHDLYPEHYADLTAHHDGTGMEVVNWIVEHKEAFQHTTFIVHTLNPTGGDRMIAALAEHNLIRCRKPFAWANVLLQGRPSDGVAKLHIQ